MEGISESVGHAEIATNFYISLTVLSLKPELPE